MEADRARRTSRSSASARAAHEAGIGAVVCHALYLVNLASPDPEIHAQVGRGDAGVARDRLGDRRRGRGLPRRLAPRRGLDGGLARVVPALRELLELTDDRLWLADGELGRRRRDDRPLGRRARRPSSTRSTVIRRLGICLDSCHWWVSGVDVTDPEALDAALAELDERIGLDRLRCLHVNDAEVGLGSNRDRHASLGEGTIGDGLATFLAHPAFQELPAILETAGPDGSDAGELALLRELHRRGRRRRPKRWR